MRPEIIVAATILVSVLGLGGLLPWVFARLYAKPKRRSSSKTPEAYGLRYKPISSFSSGCRLQGWYVHPGHDGPATRVIVLVHGWSRGKDQMLPVAKFLSEAGYASLLMDMRGHGRSDNAGPITIVKFAEDISAAIDHLEDTGLVNGGSVAVLGHSMGGASAILAGSRDKRVQALISSFAFADPVQLTLGFMRKARLPRWPFFPLVRWHIERWLGTTMEDVAPFERIAQLSIPTLLVHGGSDHFIPLTNLRLLYQRAAKQQTERLILSGRKHSDVLLDPGYAQKVLVFLSRNLDASSSNRERKRRVNLGQAVSA